MIASDIMTPNPVALAATSTVRQAVRLLETLEVRHLPVVDEEGTLVGMVSDRDLRGLTLPAFSEGEHVGQVRTALDASIADIMTGGVVSADVETDVEEIVSLMLENRIGAVPIVDGDGALVGIVSYVDVLRETFAPEAAA
ncbi:MAG TPA: CBS domain-containing protein [Minicystis sp.]|nr:CBS domain-containing protein [Minicystis sp.]